MDVRVLLVLSRRPESDLSIGPAKEPGAGALGRLRDRAVPVVVRCSRNRELAVSLLLSPVLLPRTLPLLSERLLPALRRESGRPAGLGRQLVPQAIQPV